MDTEVTSSPISVVVNGSRHELTVDHRVTVLDLLREALDLTGSKKGCDHGQCGACTILLDGRRVNACLTLAVMVDGHEVITVEGLATDARLSVLQRAFIDHDALQCGYCTPGQLCSAVGLLDELRRGWPSAVTPDVAGDPAFDEHEVAERLSGNLCRCGAYVNIVPAVLEAGAEESARP